LCVQEWTNAFVEHLTQLQEHVLKTPVPKPEPEPTEAECDAKEEPMSVRSVVDAKEVAGSLAEGVPPKVSEQ
jgi:hypothetical protein